MKKTIIARIEEFDRQAVTALDNKHLRANHVFVDGDNEEALIAISAYKTLRTNMLRAMQARQTKGLLITSPAKGAGKSVTAANLAVNIARHPQHEVLLVDLDFRSPSVASVFGLDVAVGIDSAVDPAFDVEQAIITTSIPRLRILPCASAHQNSSEMLLSRPVSSIIHSLQKTTSKCTVIFDAPPVLGCDDVSAIAPIIDLGLVVVGEAQTSRRELRYALTDLEGIDLAGVLLNKSSKKFFQQYYYGQ